MNVGAVGAVTSGSTVYAALSPYLNGVRRTSDAAAADWSCAAATQTAIAARSVAAAAATAAPPFISPAISEIAQRIALGEALVSTSAVTPNALLGAPLPPTATNTVLHGDAGTLIQSYGAVALLYGAQNLASAYGLTSAPDVTAPAAVPGITRLAAVG
jgi:hypothetical protein